MAAVNITAGQYAQAQSARAELSTMLLEGTTGGGTIVAPFLGLTGVPAAALDLYEVVHLAALRLFSAFQAFNNVTASYPHTSGSFTTKGGSLLILVSATARPNAAGMHGIDVKVDAGTVGVIEMWGNVTTEHYRHSRPLLVTGIAAGAHTLGLALRANTNTDANDRVNAVVFELPF